MLKIKKKTIKTQSLPSNFVLQKFLHLGDRTPFDFYLGKFNHSDSSFTIFLKKKVVPHKISCHEIGF